MNDDYVSPVGQQQVQNSKAYILFYKMVCLFVCLFVYLFACLFTVHTN